MSKCSGVFDTQREKRERKGEGECREVKCGALCQDFIVA
jgi:hypothetical protein